MDTVPSPIALKKRISLLITLKNQKEHHKTESFYDEYKRLLIENGIQFDEKISIVRDFTFNPFRVVW